MFDRQQQERLWEARTISAFILTSFRFRFKSNFRANKASEDQSPPEPDFLPCPIYNPNYGEAPI